MHCPAQVLMEWSLHPAGVDEGVDEGVDGVVTASCRCG